ncbi:MAG: hypothetical protein ACW960_01675 [Candidatus Thorarchaeota archaeon]|jgi:hypothetical protein
MKRKVLALAMLLVFIQLQVPAKAQTVVRIQNLKLAANEFYSAEIVVQPQAPYRILSDIHPFTAETTEELVVISFRSEGAGGFGVIYHSGDQHRNTTWTPRGAEYVLNITNREYLAEVFVNLTVAQIGPPTITIVPWESIVASAFVPLAIAILMPPALFAVAIAFYRKFRLRKSK